MSSFYRWLCFVLVAVVSTGCARSTTDMAPADPASFTQEQRDQADQDAQTFGLSGDFGHPQTVAYPENAMTAPSSQTYYFAFDGSTVRAEDQQALNVQAHYLATHPHATVRLEGNTDNRGSREYNIALGWRRDQAVNQLMAQAGVRADQVKMVSYGKEQPAVVGDNEHAWALNRRVNLIYTRSS